MSNNNPLLAADIGGTKTLLRLCFKQSSKQFDVLHEQRFVSADFPTFEDMLHEFLKQANLETNIVSACIGVAGPVRDNIAKVTNLPWQIQAEKIAHDFSIPKVQLINDFQAIGYGINLLTEQELVNLQQGESHDQGVIAVLGAGTGLGEAFLVWSKDHYKVYATEGGHASFAPTDAEQIEFLQYLSNKYDVVSYDRVLCGLGIENCYGFYCDVKGLSASATMQDFINEQGIAPAVTKFSNNNEDALAVKVLDMFVTIYGSQAANLALTTYATGGVYVAGGIAPRIIEKLRDGTFIRAFLNKGRLRPMLEKVPVNVIVNPKVGLVGAMVAADLLASERAAI